VGVFIFIFVFVVVGNRESNIGCSPLPLLPLLMLLTSNFICCFDFLHKFVWGILRKRTYPFFFTN
jgi:hypothetical protein